jgi:FRG domain
MARTPRWNETDVKDGVIGIDLSRWAYFDDYIRQEMLDFRNFIWRGQCAAAWSLESTLDRLLRKRGQAYNLRLRAEHLQRFMMSTRGRRGPNPPNMSTENDWWALGQHYGLATPLLDWSTSPYVAAYFAFVPEENDRADRRAVWGLWRDAVERKSKEIANTWTESGRAPVVDLVEPRSDENARLVSQGGLFTRGPDAVSLDDWVRRNFAGEEKYIRLVKITIPNRDRDLALRTLNRMNINHLSLFPDIYGASKYANLDLLIEKY